MPLWEKDRSVTQTQGSEIGLGSANGSTDSVQLRAGQHQKMATVKGTATTPVSPLSGGGEHAAGLCMILTT